MRLTQSLPQDSVYTRLRLGLTWNLIATVANQGSSFLSNVLIANIVGRVAYGKYATVANTLLSISSIAQLATGYTVTKYIAEFRFTNPARAGRVMQLCSYVAAVSSLISGAGLLLCSRFLADHVLKAPELSMPTAIGAIFLGLSTYTGFQMGVLAGVEAYRALARTSITAGVVTVASCAALAYFAGLKGAVTGLALSAVIRYFLFRHVAGTCVERAGIDGRGDWRSERRILFRFAIPAALAGLSVAPASWLGNVALVRSLNGFSEMAVYSAAFSLVIMVMFIPRVGDRVVMTVINDRKGAGDDQGYRRVFWINVGLTTTLIVLGAIFMALFGPALLHIFGKSFVQEGRPVLYILLMATVPEGVSMSLGQVLQSNERLWTYALGINLPRDMTFVVLAFLLARRGATGLAEAYLCSQCVCLAAMIAVLARTRIRSYKAVPAVPIVAETFLDQPDLITDGRPYHAD